MTSRRTAVCTICAKNYLHFARTLMDSVADAQPEWDRFVVLVDRVDGAFDPAAERFRVIEATDLGLPRPQAFCFRYTILELNTAVKPWALARLFSEGYDRVVYLDPDIRVYRPLREVEETLDAGAFCVLTPHLTASLDDGRKPSEREILQAGAYNLGFLALARHPSLEPFLAWWQRRLERDCVVDFENGLFVDQKWIDLVPGLYEGAAVLRHEGYNVAYWNLARRNVATGDGGATVNGVPLVFFHFSGLDPLAPGPFSKHQDRFRLDTLGPVRPLVEAYCEEVRAHGLETCVRWPWAYARFDDGTPVPDVLRRHFRNHPELEELPGGEDPFRLGPGFFNEPSGGGARGPLVSRFLKAVWEARPDLRHAFPDPEGEHREALARWLLDVRDTDFDVDPVWLEPVRTSLAAPGSGGSPARRVARVARAIARRVLPTPAKRFLRRIVAPARPASGPARAVRALGRRLPRTWKTRIRGLVGTGPVVLPERGARRRPDSVVLRFGFHDADAHCRSTGKAWMGRRAVIRVPSLRGEALRIVGEYSPDPFVRSGLPATTRLRLAVDGEEIGTIVLERGGPFDESLSLPARNGSHVATIELEADQQFVPAEAGLGEDRRRLSVEIAQVAAGERVLVDFGAAGAPAEGEPRPGATGLNVIGYLRAELGVGESARLAAEAARAAGLPLALVDFEAGCESPTGDDRLAAEIGDANPHPVNLFHVNADQMPLAYATLGASFFEGRTNIGYWAWELPELPEEWLPSFHLVDEVWTPSRFCADAIGAASPVPVQVIPHPIRFEEPVPDRAAFGLPERRFLVLTMWDMHSFRGRKNPEGALEAYRLAFAGRDDAGLVIKTMNTSTYPDEWAALRERLLATPGVTILDRTLPREDVYRLEASCDAFLSMHRSEGFGLGLAECMYLGKPAVGTAWSGNVDFMREGNSCPVRYRLIRLDRDHGPYRKGQTWADPDPEHAAWHLRRLADDAELRERIAAEGRRTVREELSPEAVGRRYARRLEAIARWR